MVFIFGGAYQGKTDFAREAFSLAEGDIFSCSGTEIDFSRRCVDHIENFTLPVPVRGSIRSNTSVRTAASGNSVSLSAGTCSAALCRWARKRARGGRIPAGSRSI